MRKESGQRVLLIVGDSLDTAVGATGYLYLCREDGAELRKLVWRKMTLREQLFALRISVGEFLPDELLLAIPASQDEAAVYREACRLASHLRAVKGYRVFVTLHERTVPAAPPPRAVRTYLDISSVWEEKAADPALASKPEAAKSADSLSRERGKESGYERAELFYTPILTSRRIGDGDASQPEGLPPHPTVQ